MLDSLRYAIALALLVVMPNVYWYWFSIHPGIALWRRLGVRKTMIIHYGLMVLAGAVLFLNRKSLLAVEWGTNALLIALALPLFAQSFALRRALRRHFTLGMMVGLPELDPERHPAPLVTKGIYARIRHPRYLQLLTALIAWSLVANYLATYVIAAAGFFWIWGVVHFEEKELRRRYGRVYEEYCARVPRFLPRRRA